mgnify:CR=1 FL=1
MRTYVLNNFKNGKTLYPKKDMNTAEFVHDHQEFSLDEYFLKGEHGRIYSRYRLHTRDAYHFYDTMEYDIKCPRCGDVLRLCGNPLDLHEHGLYRCRRCDEGRR